MGEERLVRGYGGHLLVAVSLGWLTLQSGRLLLPPLLPTVIEDLAITPFRAGIALSLLWGCTPSVSIRAATTPTTSRARRCSWPASASPVSASRRCTGR
ncbi:hypothetical protein ACFQJD_17605 [Haloplanus sp. GCM10025708]|uniref:hypothetical protein n=1 Tax=Haloplanus sp. GCM10025708 TaxID=3252679 RepID=UPI00361C0C92